MRSSYTPNLQQVATLQEANYKMLKQLLENHAWPQTQALSAPLSTDQQSCEIHFSFRWLEHFPYTSTLSIHLGSTNMAPMALTVRCYHDARMAEVVDRSQANICQYQGRYTYPNPKMRQPDEKYQLNQLLADWLQYCFTGSYHFEPSDSIPPKVHYSLRSTLLAK